MDILLTALVILGLIYLQHRDDETVPMVPYTLVDRDVERVQADLRAGADRLARDAYPSAVLSDAWERRA